MAIFDDNHGLGRQKIIGWALGKGMTAEETVIKAFLMVITNIVIMVRPAKVTFEVYNDEIHNAAGDEINPSAE